VWDHETAGSLSVAGTAIKGAIATAHSTPALALSFTESGWSAGCNLGRMDAGHPVYVSKVRIVREHGPIRQAYLPGEADPITFGTHGPVREHYGTAPGQYPEHATTLDYVVAATAG